MKNRAGLLALAIGLLFGRAFGVTQLITNGGFEVTSGQPWQISGGLQSVPIVVNPSGAHSGSNYLSLGNFTGITNQAVFQTVTIPTNALLAQFTYFWGCAVGNDIPGEDQFDAVVQNNQGSVSLTTQPSANTGTYQGAGFDLTRYAGQTVNLGFVVRANVAGAGAQTFFGVDDVSLLVYTAADIPSNDYFTNATVITTTNGSMFATNVLATKEPGEPRHAGALGGHSVWWRWVAPANGTVNINTIGSSFDTVLAVYTGTVVSNLTQVAANDDINANQGIFASQVKFTVTAGTEYKIAVDGKAQATGTIQLNLIFTTDTTPPTIKISSPKSGTKLTNSTVTAQGTATDNVGVALVQYRLENANGTNDYQNATGTNNWTANVTGLIPGPNTIRIQAFDTSSNVSSNFITVNYTVVSPITVTVSGSGTVSPNLNGQLLAVGNTFTMTAKPGSGQVFSNWTGSITATTAALTFVMQSNMVLQANFTPNPFTPVAGTYQGLFFDTNGPAHKSSGFFNIIVGSSGSMSAKVMVAGKSYSLSGTFSAGGSFSNNIARKGLTTVSVQMNLDMSGGGIAGVLSDGTWIAELTAGRVTTSPGATAGKYTLLIPGGVDGVAQPGGDSYGTVTVSSSGAISFKGVLADNSKVTEKANLLASGDWAFYVPLYSGNGSILGLLSFSNAPDSDISGTVDWFKPAGAGLYPAGFTNNSEAMGSVYKFASGTPVLNISPGQLWLANGNLPNSFTNQIAMDSSSKITSTNSTLKVTVTTSTGLFKGTVANQATGKTISFTGIVLQKQNLGGGFFVGTNQVGRVFLGP